jgi:hypothetical protein
MLDTTSVIRAEYNGTVGEVAAIEGINNSEADYRNYGVLGTYNHNFYGVGVVGYAFGFEPIPAGFFEAGVYGSGSAVGVWAHTTGGTALYAEATAGGYAAQLIGRLQYADGTEGPGKVLTSDALGNAVWDDVANPRIGFMAQDQIADSVPDATIADVVFDRVAYDDGSGYDPLTGIYTAPSAGVYHFDASVIWDAFAVASSANIMLEVDGLVVAASTSPVSTTSAFNGQLNIDLPLQAGSTVKVQVVQYTLGTETLCSTCDAVFSHFSGHKIY